VGLAFLSNIASDKIFVTTCHRQSDFIYEASLYIQCLEVGLYTRSSGMMIFLALAPSDKRVTNRPFSSGSFQQLMAMLDFCFRSFFVAQASCKAMLERMVGRTGFEPVKA
jgi:hypothetical protein